MISVLYGEELIVCENRRKSAVKYLLFFCSPVVSGPAFAAYCHLPTVFLSRVADSCFRFLFLGRLEIQDPRPDRMPRKQCTLPVKVRCGEFTVHPASEDPVLMGDSQG